MQVIEEHVYAQIQELSAKGDALADAGSFEEAIAAFEEALKLLPDPLYIWEASTWLFTAIGDVAFQSEDFARAEEALREAVKCPGALQNPFVRLRRGQVFFELGDLPKAGEELAAAYMLEGAAIFENEDPKYFAHLKTVLTPPASGAW